MKEGKSSVWQIIPINSIEGFAYVEGNEYELSVYKTTLSNPPMDGSNVKYKLIEVLQQNKD
ncbi:MAG: DUF4377 domain-containing protein [Marinifilaceae bacterium]